MVDYLNILTTPLKPPRLTNEDFKTGDVAFGEVNNGILWMAFTRNNVLVLIDAPINDAKVISSEIDKRILDAPTWKDGMAKPSFVLPY